MSSIRDVAKKANVGTATVSRYLNGTGYVSKEAQAKIEAAVKELDYTPNELARNLYCKKTGIIAVLVPDSAHPFFAEFVKNIETELYANGYKTMICNTVKEFNCELEYLEMLKRHIVDGIVSGVHSLEIEEYQKIDRPIVALDRYLGEAIPDVAVNHKQGGALAAKRLIEAGVKCAVQFQGSLEVESPSHDRHFEFQRIMEENGAAVYSYILEWNSFDYSDYEKMIQRAFKEHPEIDGVFAEDMLAVGSLKEAARCGKSVPEDLKVIAYDGTYLTKMAHPTLTAVVQPFEQLAQEITRVLLNRIQGRQYKNKYISLDVVLREGETT